MNEEKLLSAKRLFFIALGLDILVTAIVIASDLWGVDVLKAIGAGASDADASVISAFAFWDKFAYLMLLTTLGVGLALVKWLNACYSYAIHGLGASGFKQQGWTLGGWAIPFFNLFKPYQVINEIYKSGNSTYVEPDGWKRVGGSGLLLTWWIFWAVTHLFGWIASKQFIKTALREDMTLDQTIAAIQFHAGFCVVAIVISGFWFIVANTLTDRLLAREAVARSTESPMRMTDSVQSSPNLSQAPLEPAMFTGNAPTANIESKRAMTHQAAPQINTTTDTSPINSIAPTEEDHWATAITELESGQRRPGVWAKAYAEADGDETKAKVAYLKARVQQLVGAENTTQSEGLSRSTQPQQVARTARAPTDQSIANATRELATNGYQTIVIRPACYQVTKDTQTRYFYTDHEFVRFADALA
jgi:hypothetical protein